MATLLPGTREALYAAVHKPSGPDTGPLLVTLTGRCPRCRRDLQELAVVDQQLDRRRCSCGAELPPDWRARLRSYLARWDWLEKLPKFKRWVPAQDDRVADLHFTIRPLKFTAAELAEAQRR